MKMKRNLLALLPMAAVTLHYAGDNEGSVGWLWLSPANVTEYIWKEQTELDTVML